MGVKSLEHPTFLGIDLTGSDRRPSACALLDAGDRVLDVGFVGDDADILRLVERHTPRYVALDAPFGLPRGMCCLEESCPCAPESPHPGRACERELASRYGIPCFWTTKRTIIKAMVYRAIGLRSALEARGPEVLETYPYAIKVRLFGRRLPRKSTREGVAHLRRRLLALLPTLAPWVETHGPRPLRRRGGCLRGGPAPSRTHGGLGRSVGRGHGDTQRQPLWCIMPPVLVWECAGSRPGRLWDSPKF